MSWVTNSTDVFSRCHILVRICCMMTRVCASSEPNGSSQQQHLRAGRERPDDADALLHAARQAFRILILEREQTGKTEQRAGGGLALAALHALHLQAELDVLAHRLPGEQRVLLKHHAAVGARSRDRIAVDGDFAAGRLEKAGDRVEQRGFSAARWADDRNEFAGIDVDRSVATRPRPPLPACRSSGRNP